MKITLASGSEVLVDADLYPVLSLFKWSMQSSGYAKAYVGGGGTHPMYSYMHRMVLLAGPGDEVDHINGDKLDNRRANLRLCTHSENHRNKPRQRNSGTGYKGVYYDRRRRVWCARIYVGGHHRYLGAFASAEEAGEAYDREASATFGGFARLNREEDR